LGHPFDAELLAVVAHAKCAFSASKPPWKTSFAKNPSQWPTWSRSQSKVVHHSTKLSSPSVTGVTRIGARESSTSNRVFSKLDGYERSTAECESRRSRRCAPSVSLKLR